MRWPIIILLLLAQVTPITRREGVNLQLDSQIQTSAWQRMMLHTNKKRIDRLHTRLAQTKRSLLQVETSAELGAQAKVQLSYQGFIKLAQAA